MKKLLTRILIFCLPFIALFLLLEYISRMTPSGYNLKRISLENNLQSIDTLILGSSHAYYCIHPDYFEGQAFNLAFVSQSIYYDHALLKKYVNQLSGLKNLIIPISYFSLSYELENGMFNWRKYPYYWYFDCNSQIDRISPISPRAHIKILAIGFRRSFDSALNYFKGKNNITCSKKGWITGYPLENDLGLVKSGKMAAKRHDKISASSDFSANIERLEEIFLICKEKNINAFLVTLPAWKTYRNNIDQSKYKNTINVCRMLSDKYANVTYYNFLFDDRFTEKDFYDADHLNYLGAQRFTLLLNGLVQKGSPLYNVGI